MYFPFLSILLLIAADTVTYGHWVPPPRGYGPYGSVSIGLGAQQQQAGIGGICGPFGPNGLQQQAAIAGGPGPVVGGHVPVVGPSVAVAGPSSVIPPPPVTRVAKIVERPVIISPVQPIHVVVHLNHPPPTWPLGPAVRPAYVSHPVPVVTQPPVYAPNPAPPIVSRPVHALPPSINAAYHGPVYGGSLAQQQQQAVFSSPGIVGPVYGGSVVGAPVIGGPVTGDPVIGGSPGQQPQQQDGFEGLGSQQQQHQQAGVDDVVVPGVPIPGAPILPGEVDSVAGQQQQQQMEGLGGQKQAAAGVVV